MSGAINTKTVGVWGTQLGLDIVHPVVLGSFGIPVLSGRISDLIVFETIEFGAGLPRSPFRRSGSPFR